MKFRYELDVKKILWPITHQHQLMLMGSCFTENIGEKLKKYKFSVLQNPHGILFNPVSVCDALEDYVVDKKDGDGDLFQLNESWHSWKHHSKLSGITKAEAVEKINSSNSEAHAFLKRADYLVITLGSAWVYALTDRAIAGRPGMIAANNHKAPADWFHHYLLKEDDVTHKLTATIEKLKDFNPGLKIIFTISPVRHLREGVIENNRSKAVLIQAVHSLVEKFDNTYYFPAYELVIDDLRDYRYYSEDLVHPNYFATQYVWEKLLDACMDSKTRKLMEEIHLINLAFQHKPFNANTEQHKKFLQTHFKKTQKLQEQHPHLDLEEELKYFYSTYD